MKAVFTELRDLFLETNHKVLNGEIDRNYKGRIVEADALHAYINYTFGQCLSEDQAEFEMDRVSHTHTAVLDGLYSIISGRLLTTRVSLFMPIQLDRQRGRCLPEQTQEVFGMHLNMGIIDGLDLITQPVVRRVHHSLIPYSSHAS